MRRVSVKMLLLSCAAFLLAIDGCSSDRLGANRQASVRGVPGDDEGEKDAKKEKGAPFVLPDDQAGRLLGEVLPPTPRPGHLRNPTPPAPPVVPWPRLAVPQPSVPGSEPTVPRLPAPRRKQELRPRLVVEENLGENPEGPLLPRRPSFPVASRTFVPSVDAALPPPLPLMAQPLPDRVSLDDATTEGSLAAVLSAPLPRRETPVPFVRTRVPDPFPNRRPLTTKPPEEEPTPVADSPAGPK